MSDLLLKIILCCVVFVTLYIILNVLLLFVFILRRKKIAVPYFGKTRILTAKGIFLITEIMLCFYLFDYNFGAVLDMAPNAFQIFTAIYLFIVIPVTPVFALLTVITGIPVFRAVQRANISKPDKIMLYALNTLPVFDILTIIFLNREVNI
ncbi:MAG: hypothetical protein IJR59_06660 [Firmicutes bacterium]|nr:hypothetical protein [Bacillota bacterium]